MDPYEFGKGVEEGEEFYAWLMDQMPGWIFTGFDDGSGSTALVGDTRKKGERLRDIALAMNKKGYSVDIAYGKEGELMWNGLLRGAKAEAMARV
jgi:hypothetical protein